MEKSLEAILKRLNTHYRAADALSAGADELAGFLKDAYADQVNAADYKDNGKIFRRRDWLSRGNPNFNNDFAGTSIIAKTPEGKIVGHFGIIDFTLKAGDQLYQAAWGRDLIILPGQRKLGIGPFLIEHMLKTAKKSQYSMFLIAGLNDQVYPIYKKFGFTDLGHIPLYLKFNAPKKIFTGKIKNRFLAEFCIIAARFILFGINCLSSLFNIRYLNLEKDITIEKIASFDKAFDGLWERVSVKFPLISKRDSCRLNWRFVEQPYWKYTIFKATDKKSGLLTGYIVLRQGKSRGFDIGIISDIFADPADKRTIFALLKSALSYFKGIKEVEFIRCNILHGAFEKILSKAGFFKAKSSSRFMVYNFGDRPDAGFVSKRENWFIDYADSDLDLVL